MKHHDIAKQNLYEEIYTKTESTTESIATFILVAVAAILWSLVFMSI